MIEEQEVDDLIIEWNISAISDSEIDDIAYSLSERVSNTFTNLLRPIITAEQERRRLHPDQPAERYYRLPNVLHDGYSVASLLVGFFALTRGERSPEVTRFAVDALTIAVAMASAKLKEFQRNKEGEK